MSKILTVKHISLGMQAPMEKVYDFVSEIKNLPKWAEGLDETMIGQMKITFAPKNPFGVLDHDVTLPSGEVFYNPMRVIKNAGGSEVTFVLFRYEGVTDEAYQKDEAQILKDLKKLKSLLEH